MSDNEIDNQWMCNLPFDFSYFPENPDDFNGIIVLLREPGEKPNREFSPNDKEVCIEGSRNYIKEVFSGLTGENRTRYRKTFEKIVEYAGPGSKVCQIAYGNIKWTPGGSTQSGEYKNITPDNIGKVVDCAIERAKGYKSATPVKAVFFCYEVLDKLKRTKKLPEVYLPKGGKVIQYANGNVKRASLLENYDVELFEIYHPASFKGYFEWEGTNIPTKLK